MNLKQTIMRNLLIVLFLTSAVTVMAQDAPKVVLQLQTADTLAHKSAYLQVANIKKVFPNAEVELVCHGPGIEFLLKKKSFYVNKLNAMKLSNVSYVACEFTMSMKNIKREDLVETAGTVPYGIAELIKKQQLDWIYVKLGF